MQEIIKHKINVFSSFRSATAGSGSFVSIYFVLLYCCSLVHTWIGLRHFGKTEASVEEVQAYLEKTYCGHLSVETSQLSSLEERVWFADRFEELKKKSLSAEEKRQLAKVMLESQVSRRKRTQKHLRYYSNSYMSLSLR